MNPIQQLVDAANAFCRACCITKESAEAEQQAILEGYSKTCVALAAVESAQVETSWEVQVTSKSKRGRNWIQECGSQAQADQYAEMIRNPNNNAIAMIIRYDTYSSVESDQ